jgi:hypothetical protein
MAKTACTGSSNYKDLEGTHQDQSARKNSLATHIYWYSIAGLFPTEQEELHSAQCTVHGAQCTVHSAHCTLTMHSAHCTVRMHSAHCTVHSAQCTVHGA